MWGPQGTSQLMLKSVRPLPSSGLRALPSSAWVTPLEEPVSPGGSSKPRNRSVYSWGAACSGVSLAMPDTLFPFLSLLTAVSYQQLGFVAVSGQRAELPAPGSQLRVGTLK